MKITINISDKYSDIEKMAVTEALQTVADKATFSNILFIQELASKPGINDKLEKKKKMILNRL